MGNILSKEQREAGTDDREGGVMIRLDFNLACHMACTGLPDGWVIEIHLEGSRLARAFPAQRCPAGIQYGWDDDGGPNVESNCRGQKSKRCFSGV